MRGVSIIEAMVIDMNEAQIRTLEQVRQVVAGTQALEFRRAEDDEGRYVWIEQVLHRFEYRRLGRADKGAVLAVVELGLVWGRARRLGRVPAAQGRAFVLRIEPQGVAPPVGLQSLAQNTAWPAAPAVS